MFTSSAQYFILLPSYICTLQVYAFCTLRDRLEVPQPSTSEAQQQEDYYKSVRTYMVVCWLVANAILAMAVSETYGPKAVSDNAYLKVVLWSVASLALFRALGSSTFGIINCVEACVEGRVKFSMKAPKWMGGFGEKMGEKWRDGMSS